MSETPTQDLKSSKWNRWIGPALVASLAINIFLAGTLVPGLVRHVWDGPDMYHGGPGMSGFAMRMPLPPEAREMMREAMRQSFRENRQGFAEQRERIRAARLKLADAVEQDPYDPEATRAAFFELESSISGMTRNVQDAMVSAIGRLGAAQRAEIAETLRKSPPNDRSSRMP